VSNRPRVCKDLVIVPTVLSPKKWITPGLVGLVWCGSCAEYTEPGEEREEKKKVCRKGLKDKIKEREIK